MAIASTRQVTVAGHTIDLVTTSMFQGQQGRVVETCFVSGTGHDVRYSVRLLFERCSADDIADALARVTIHW